MLSGRPIIRVDFDRRGVKSLFGVAEGGILMRLVNVGDGSCLDSWRGQRGAGGLLVVANSDFGRRL